MRIHFDELFIETSTHFIPKQNIDLNGFNMQPDLPIDVWTDSAMNINLGFISGKYLEVDKKQNTYKIKGVFPG
jgi:hypothetical protein